MASYVATNWLLICQISVSFVFIIIHISRYQVIIHIKRYYYPSCMISVCGMSVAHRCEYVYYGLNIITVIIHVCMNIIMIKLLVLHIVLLIIFTVHVITCQLFYINSKRILSFYCDYKYIILRHLKHVYGIASCDNCFIKKNNEGLLMQTYSYTLISYYVQLCILGDPCRVKIIL